MQLHAMPLGQALDLLCALPAKSIILCFENMQAAKAAPFLRRLPLKQACHILARLETLKAAQIFAALPVPFKARLKTVLDKDLYNTLTTVLAYPKDSAAAFMAQDYLAFKTDTKVRDIVIKLKNLPREKFVSQVFVKDKNAKVAGLIRTQNFAFLDRENLAGSLMQNIEYRLAPEDKIEKAFALFKKGVYQIPVIDEKKTLLGVLNAADFIKSKTPLEQKAGQESPAKIVKLTLTVILILFLIWKVFLCK